MRSLTQATRMALYSQETGDVFLTILALTHADITPMYFVANTSDVVVQGQTYMAFPFDLQLPDDSDEITRVRLTIDNVDRRIVEAVRIIGTPPKFTLSWIRAAEPDVLVAGPIPCALRNVSYGAQIVGGDLAPFEDITNEAFPRHTFDPANFPGVFA